MTKVPKKKISPVPLAEIDVCQEFNRMDVDPDKIGELAKSIEAVGLLQPILVRPLGERYEIVAGRRRWMASQVLELTTIDAVVTKMSDQDAAIIRATENLARENLSPIEEARIFEGLITKYGMDDEEVGEKFGYKAGTVRRRLDLIKMPPELQDAVHTKKISTTVAYELWPIADKGDLNYYLTFAIENGCSKATARGWCKEWKDSKRRDRETGGGGGRPPGINEPNPVYVACDLCVGPMAIGQETLLRICGDCFKTIKQNM